MLKILTKLLEYGGKNIVVFSQIGALLAVVVAVLKLLNELWLDLFARLDSLTVGAFGTADFSPCSFINYIFPLDDVLNAITIYAALRIACAGVRIVKSFIPTISG